jgi:hypothetical protein
MVQLHAVHFLDPLEGFPISELTNNAICISDILRLNAMALWAELANVGVMSSHAQDQEPLTGVTAFC